MLAHHPPVLPTFYNVRKWAEIDGMEYVAGFITRKFLRNYPHLGDYTNNKYTEIHSYALPSWVQSLSFGGLVKPSECWLKIVLIMDKYFRKFHKDTFYTGKRIIERTTDYIKASSTLNPFYYFIVSFLCRHDGYISYVIRQICIVQHLTILICALKRTPSLVSKLYCYCNYLFIDYHVLF